MNFNYDNIAISGGVGVGKGTLQNNLKSYLEPYGWKFRSTGQLVREYTKEFTKPLAKLAPDDFHKKIDGKVRELFEKDKNWIIEAWLAGTIARGLKKTLKILLVCSKIDVTIDRVVNRDKVTVEEAKKIIKDRTSEHFDTFERIYGYKNIFNPKNYDLVIDTYSSGPMETVGKVLDKLGYDHKKISIKTSS